MGIDIYAEWRGQTHEEQQEDTWSSVVHGHVGYLREAYHGEPYATALLCREAFEAPDNKADIPAALLRQRLPHALALTQERYETYIKVKGQWVYLYRAVDKEGQTGDFYLSEHRDIEAAKAFFRKVILHNGTPQKITLDGYPASHRAVEYLQNEAIIPAETVLRSCPYLNNIVEQDHRGIKSRTGLCWVLNDSTTPPLPLPASSSPGRLRKGSSTSTGS